MENLTSENFGCHSLHQFLISAEITILLILRTYVLKSPFNPINNIVLNNIFNSSKIYQFI